MKTAKIYKSSHNFHFFFLYFEIWEISVVGRDAEIRARGAGNGPPIFRCIRKLETQVARKNYERSEFLVYESNEK